MDAARAISASSNISGDASEPVHGSDAVFNRLSVREETMHVVFDSVHHCYLCGVLQ